MTRDARIRVGGILKFRPLCLVGVMSAPDRPGLASAIFDALGKADLNAQFIVQCIDLNNDSHILFCTDSADRERALEVIEPVAQTLQARKVTVVPSVALVSVYGPDFRERPGIAGRVFGALAEEGINILAVSTSISTISCVIQEEACEQAIAALHRVFALP